MFIGLYNCRPAFSLYSCDETSVLGIFWNGVGSSEGTQFVISSQLGGGLSNHIDKHFSLLWESASWTSLYDLEKPSAIWDVWRFAFDGESPSRVVTLGG